MKFCLLPLVLLAMPAIAQEPPAAPGQEKQICRRIAATGSNVSKRVCHTAAEWKALSKSREKDKEGFRDRPLNAQPVGN